MDFLAYIPEMVSVSPFGFTIYNDYSVLPKRTEQREKFKMPTCNSTKGILSPGAKKNLKNCVGYLILRTQRRYATKRNKFPNVSKKIGFVTLTLPSKQIHTDNEIKSNCLNQFLIETCKEYNVKEYVWRAEKQKNGNLHFHLLFNQFVPYEVIRDKWNRIINKLGYVDTYKAKHENLTIREYVQLYPVQQKKGQRMEDRMRQYQNGKNTNWQQPNSTDVQKLEHVNNAGRYISKYVSKGVKETKQIIDQKAKIEAEPDELRKLFETETLKEMQNAEAENYKIEGRLWYASSTLTNIKNLKFELTPELKIELSRFINWSKAKELKTDFCFWYNRGIENLAKFARSELSRISLNWLENNLSLQI